MYRLKEYRTRAGESQAFLASLLNVTQQAYANYESGKRKPDVMTLSVLARHYGVTVEDLLEEPNTAKTPTPKDERHDDQVDGLAEKLSKLSPALRKQFVRFLALAKEDPERAARFLEFAAQELEPRE